MNIQEKKLIEEDAQAATFLVELLDISETIKTAVDRLSLGCKAKDIERLAYAIGQLPDTLSFITRNHEGGQDEILKFGANVRRWLSVSGSHA